jgi:3,4-dihydroxy 2-butanone 4-phosphate synthase/GTP cyclohydrolase II
MFANPTPPHDAQPVAAAVPVSDRMSAALAAFRHGAMLVVTDDDDRENEGDLIMAAVHCTPRDMGFIVRHTSGIVCTPLTRAIADRLDLPPMVARNDAPFATAFTVSVDVREGTTTGISAADRSLTVQALARADTRPGDFVRPGHIFPLVARDGGVLERDGHTEAAVDLCRLTGLPPVGVICELVNDDGSVMRGDDLARFRAVHGLMQISIAELIALRLAQEGAAVAA